MEIIEKNTATNTGQLYEKNDVTDLFEELQIAFPDQISLDIYHNVIKDYYKSLNTILRQFS